MWIPILIGGILLIEILWILFFDQGARTTLGRTARFVKEGFQQLTLDQKLERAQQKLANEKANLKGIRQSPNYKNYRSRMRFANAGAAFGGFAGEFLEECFSEEISCLTSAALYGTDANCDFNFDNNTQTTVDNISGGSTIGTSPLTSATISVII